MNNILQSPKCSYKKRHMKTTSSWKCCSRVKFPNDRNKKLGEYYHIALGGHWIEEAFGSNLLKVKRRRMDSMKMKS